MSDWFRGTIEGAYVGTPARVKASSLLEVFPFDITLYRASISAIERIPPPKDAGSASSAAEAVTSSASTDTEAVGSDTATAASKPEAAGKPAAAASDEGTAAGKQPLALRQAELNDVVFLGLGSADARDHHAAYDLRVTDVRLLDSTESEGRLYGRLVGTVVGSLNPSAAMAREAEAQHRRVTERRASIGTWVESLRWVMIALAAWLAFGLCGGTAGALWLAVVLPSALLRLLLSGVFAPTHGARVFGWALVLASATLGGLLYYRVTTLECESALWWLSGMALAVVVSAVLPSRYPFLWTKLVLATSTICLCAFGGSGCEQGETPPSVISQGPRTDPDGRWPRDPGEFEDVHPHESREVRAPISLERALQFTTWPSSSLPVITVPLAALLTDGPARDVTLDQLGQLITRHADRTIVLEVHAAPELGEAAMALLERWAGDRFTSGYRPQIRSAGNKFPLVPTDSAESVRSVNDRLEVWLEPD